MCIIIVSAYDILGCTCKNKNTIIEDYNSTSLIFAGTVVRFSDTTGFVFNISTLYKGSIFNDRSVSVRSEGGNCSYEFKIGEKYLVFAFEDEGAYFTDKCTRTATYESSELNLIFLNNLPQSLETSYILGSLVHWENHDQRFFEVTKLKNQKITLESSEFIFSTYTDENGEYLFKNIPIGKYAVKIDFDKELILESSAHDTINIMRNNCYFYPFTLVLPCTLVVSLVEAQNNPIKYYEINTQLIPASYYQIKDLYFGGSGSVKLGEDKIIYDRVPPGKYVLGVNTFFGSSSDYPYPSIYYPNVKDFEQAEVIELNEQNRIAEVEMVLQKLKTFYVKGEFITDSLKPLPHISLFLGRNNDPYSPDFVEWGVVRDNTFEISFLEDIDGWLFFELRITEDLRNKGYKYKNPKPIKIEKNTNIDNLKVVIE